MPGTAGESGTLLLQRLGGRGSENHGSRWCHGRSKTPL
jgi:hypothetical protein